jgi:hypothetical protein
MFMKEVDTSTATPPPALAIPTTASMTSGENDIDIGGTAPAGSSTYANGIWTVKGAGSDSWGTIDKGHFAYKAITGDGAIIAKVESISNTSIYSKAGVMMRTSLDQGAPRATMFVTNQVNVEQNMPNLTVYGGTGYGNKGFAIANTVPSYWVKLERIGNMITGYVSPDGTNWAATDVGRIESPVPDTIYVGLAVVSHVDNVLATATFSNVQITGGDGGAPVIVPAAPAALLAEPGDGAVPLRWQQSFGATSYAVRRATTSGGPYTTIASNVTGGSYTDTSVTNGTTYYYTVTATNSAGTSTNSPESSAAPARTLVNVATGGTATDGANNTTNASQAFDKNSSTKWLYSGVLGWLKYDLGHTETVQRYTLISADVATRDPKDWQFQGSNDGVNWTTLDTQAGQVFANRTQMNSYTVATPGAYRYYRLNVTSNNGDTTFTAVAELGLFAVKP